MPSSRSRSRSRSRSHSRAHAAHRPKHHVALLHKGGGVLDPHLVSTQASLVSAVGWLTGLLGVCCVLVLLALCMWWYQRTYTSSSGDSSGGGNQETRVAINVPTHVGYVDAAYEQVGVLVPTAGNNVNNNTETKLMPLFGRITRINRSKWNYYAMNAAPNTMRLQVIKSNRICTDDQGCDEIFDGDTVLVQGLSQPYRANIYSTLSSALHYLPFPV